MSLTKPRANAYSTGDVALLCRVSQQTAIRWIDKGLLKGFKIPGSKFRRVFKEDLERFVRDNNLPVTDLPEPKDL